MLRFKNFLNLDWLDLLKCFLKNISWLKGLNWKRGDVNERLFIDCHHGVIIGLGVYAWIGINFVLGRFNHVHNGKCPSNYFILVCHLRMYHINNV